MRQIEEFEEFDYDGYLVTTDLGSACFHFESGIVTIQGHAYSGNNTRQVEVQVEPEDSSDFNVSVSASDGELTSHDLKYDAELKEIVDVETGENL